MLNDSSNFKIKPREGDYVPDSLDGNPNKKIKQPASTTRNFREVLEREERPVPTKEKPKVKKEKAKESADEEEPLDETAIADAPRVMSLYGPSSSNKDATSKDPGDKEPKNSPLHLYKQLADKENAKPFALEASEGDADLVPMSLIGTDSEKKQKTTSRFSQEQPDLVYTMGAPAAPIENVIDMSTGISTSAVNPQLKELVERVIEKLYTLEREGKTDTIVMLKNLPQFEDARVVISSFKTASKEFNLTFENLRPDTKALLDANMTSLRLALEARGYANAVHIVTTTTFIEHNLPTDAPGQLFGRGAQEESEKRQQRNKEQAGEEQV